MIVLHHYAQYLCATIPTVPLIYKLLTQQAGYLGVAVFFFLSGFGLMESEQKSHLGFLRFLKKRLFKVYLPVLTVTFIWLLVSPLLLSQSPFNGIKITIGSRNFVLGNILVDFGDGVLWFVGVLMALYVIFYLFCIIRAWNWKVAFLFLLIAAAVSTILTNYAIAYYASISVPFFFMGVILSLNKKTSGIKFSMILLAIIAIVEFVSFENFVLAMHNAVDVIVVATLILICSIKDMDIRLPAFITTLSFDIYLVHNKVLMSMKANSATVELLPFILLTLLATIGFHFLRKKLLKL